jgi:hypothetical protein
MRSFLLEQENTAWRSDITVIRGMGFREVVLVPRRQFVLCAAIWCVVRVVYTGSSTYDQLPF